MISDQGEVALAIECDIYGKEPRIIGFQKPEKENKFSWKEKRDAYLAAVNANEVPLKYEKKKKRDKKKKIPKTDSRKLLSQYLNGQLDYEHEESEVLIMQKAKAFEKQYNSDSHTEVRATLQQLASEGKSRDELLATYTKYKPVALKARPQYAELPDQFRIVRNRIGDPLEGMPVLPTHPEPFKPTGRYTAERKAVIDKQHTAGFLWPEEEKLRHNFMMLHQDAFAWTEEEKGHFREDMFPDVLMPVVEHKPWVEKNIPIPPGMFDDVCKIIRDKINSGIYEPSNSSYRSRWFCVVKKDGKSLRLVHSLEPLNLVTIAHSGVPPATDALAEKFAGRGCGSTFDLYVGYDERRLDARSRDYTTFQTPFGALRLTTLPMGWTNSVPIFHDDVTFILQEEIPDVTVPYIDDVPVRGPATRYETIKADGTIEYETIPENKKIRRFVWEHFQDLNRVVQRIKHAGGTISGKKSFMCEPEITVVGARCTYEGRIPDQMKVSAVTNWPPCQNVSEVRSFLGTAGVCRIFVKDYATIAEPLTELLKKHHVFRWGERQQAAMDRIKEAIVNSPALRPINYDWNTPVVLAVDTSHIAVGFYIYQVDPETGKKHFARFSSIPLAGPERSYSQPKRELYGLKRALTACRYWLLGCRNLKVETDAKYIKGMLEHPDEGPNANINRWIAKILTYHFTLVHVPGRTHGPDGLSRRPWAEGDIEYPRDAEDDIEIRDEGLIDVEYPYGDLDPPLAWEEFKDQIDTRTGFLNVLAESVEDFQEEIKKASEDDAQYRIAFTRAMVKKLENECHDSHRVAVFKAEELLLPTDEDRNDPEIRETYPEQSQKAKALENRLEWVKMWLASFDLSIFNKMKGSKKRFLRLADKFLLGKNKKLYRKDPGGKHRLYVAKEDRMFMMKAGHDSLGHRGVYATRALLEERFWWPDMESDVKWYVKTCHKCQTRIARYQKRAPEVTYTPALFEICHADTMHMPKPCGTYNLVIHARDSLTSWPEFRAVTNQNANVCAEFLFEDVICRWGLCKQIVTDNAQLWIKAVKYLQEKYGIRGISISPYNSQANGKVERYHLDIREALVKATGDNLSQWRFFVPHVAWAERITVRKKFGCSPYFMVTGSHPIIPLDVLEATWLVELPDRTLTTEELIGYRAQALHKHQTHVVAMRERVAEEKRKRVLQYERDNLNRIITKTFKPGDLVLMRNTRVEDTLGRKMWPRYLGPLIVIRRNKGGAYVLAEMDGATLHQPVAEFRVIPYHARKAIQLPDNIHDLIDISANRLAQLETAETRWDEPLPEEGLYTDADVLPEPEDPSRGIPQPREKRKQQLEEEIADESEEDLMDSTVRTRSQRKQDREAKKKLREAQTIYAQNKKSEQKENPWKLGVHVNNDEPFIENAVLDALRLGATSFALFLKSEKRWKGHYMTPGSAMRFLSNMRVAGIKPEHVLPHGSYLINLANPSKAKQARAVSCLLDDLKRCRQLGLPLYNLHPGAATDNDKVEGIKRVAANLNLAHTATSGGRQPVIILLETMAGGGSQLGGRFEEIRAIIDGITDKSRIGVCLDTCHLFSAGYDLRTKKGWDECLADFDRVVGAPYLRAIHMNDSQHEIASKKDRHDNLGLGYIGIECFTEIVTNARFKNIPIILETPGYDEPDIHTQELRSWNQYCEDRDKEALQARIGLFRYDVLRAREQQQKRREKKMAQQRAVSMQIRERDEQFTFSSEDFNGFDDGMNG